MELNFLFGNPVKGKKGGKDMAAKKRSAAKAKPKRRRSAKKNPIKAGMKSGRSKLEGVVKPGRRYVTAAESALLRRTLEGKVKNLRAPQPKISAEEKSLADSLGIPTSILFKGTAEVEKLKKLKKTLEKSKAGVSPAQAKLINRSIQKIDDELLRAARSGETLDKKEQLARYKYILSNLSKLSEDNIIGDGWKEADLERESDWTSADMSEALFQDLEKELKGSRGGLTRSDLVKELLRKSSSPQIEDLIKKMNNPRRKKGMAKKRRKSKGAKVAYKKRRKGAKVAHKKRRKSKSAKIAAAIAAAQAGHKKRSKKRRGHKRSHKRSNPVDVGMLKDLAMIAGAGALASLAVGAVNTYGVKPLLTKFAPTVASNKAVQLAVGVAVPAALYMVMKKLAPMAKMSFLDRAADVLAVVTAANIGSRIITAALPGGMIAGVEPLLMGVEPLLMGEADFGDADFGAIEQFSGVEPVLMGSTADFGAIEQFSGHDAASLGAVQLHGDEDYAGDDMDGDADFGLG